MLKAIIFDLDGTLIDSVDLHAAAWHDAFEEFGHHVSFEEVRSQIGKGGDKLIPHFLSVEDQKRHGSELESWRGNRFRDQYLPLIRPFSAVPELLMKTRDAGLQVAIASSAKQGELKRYLDIARIADLVDVEISAEDVAESKPSPDMFQIVLEKLAIKYDEAIVVGDTPYDAEAARKANIPMVGVLSGGFTEMNLKEAGCNVVYPGPSTLFACFETAMRAAL